MSGRYRLRREFDEVTGEELHLLPKTFRHSPSGGPLWASEADAELLLDFLKELRDARLLGPIVECHCEVDEADNLCRAEFFHRKISFGLRQSGQPAEGQAGTLSAAKQPAEPAEGSSQEQETNG